MLKPIPPETVTIGKRVHPAIAAIAAASVATIIAVLIATSMAAQP